MKRLALKYKIALAEVSSTGGLLNLSRLIHIFLLLNLSLFCHVRANNAMEKRCTWDFPWTQAS